MASQSLKLVFGTTVFLLASIAQPSNLGIGAISESTQAQYEKFQGSVFVGVSRGTLFQPVRITDSYRLQASQSDVNTVLIGGRHLLGQMTEEFGWINEYAIGISTGTGTVVPTRYSISESSSKFRIFGMDIRPRVLLAWQRSDWIQPYVAFGIQAFFFRYATEMAGADYQSQGVRLNPGVGLQLIGVPIDRAYINIGASRPTTLSNREGSLLKDSIEPEVSAGLSF